MRIKIQSKMQIIEFIISLTFVANADFKDQTSPFSRSFVTWKKNQNGSGRNNEWTDPKKVQIIIWPALVHISSAQLRDRAGKLVYFRFSGYLLASLNYMCFLR